MAVGSDPRSTFVFGIKFFLPVLALILLSTLFLFSGKVDVTLSIPYVENRVDELIESQRVEGPVLRGVTQNSTPYAIASDAFETLGSLSEAFEAKNITALFDLADGEHTQVTAQLGTFVDTSKQAELLRDVVIVTTDGSVIKSDKLTADLEQGILISPNTIESKTRFGTLRAGSMILTLKGDTEHVLFKDSVKLVYTPKPKGGSE